MTATPESGKHRLRGSESIPPRGKTHGGPVHRGAVPCLHGLALRRLSGTCVDVPAAVLLDGCAATGTTLLASSTATRATLGSAEGCSGACCTALPACGRAGGAVCAVHVPVRLACVTVTAVSCIADACPAPACEEQAAGIIRKLPAGAPGQVTGTGVNDMRAATRPAAQLVVWGLIR